MLIGEDAKENRKDEMMPNFELKAFINIHNIYNIDIVLISKTY